MSFMDFEDYETDSSAYDREALRAQYRQYDIEDVGEALELARESISEDSPYVEPGSGDLDDDMASLLGIDDDEDY